MSLKISKCPILVSVLYINCYLFVLVKRKLYFCHLPSLVILFILQNSFYISIKVLIIVPRGGVLEITRNLVYFRLYHPFLLLTKAYPIIHRDINKENLQTTVQVSYSFSLILRKLFIQVEVHASRKIAFSPLQRTIIYIAQQRRKARKAVKTKMDLEAKKI